MYKRQAQPCFVGKDAPGNPLTQRPLHHDPCRATANRLQAEGPCKDFGKGPAQVFAVIQDRDQAGENIKTGCKRHQLFRKGAYPADAPHEYDARRRHQPGAYGPAGQAGQKAAQGIRDGVGLGHIADSESRQGGKQAEGSGQYPAGPAGNAPPQIYHCPAYPGPVPPLIAEQDGQQGLGIFDAHAQQGR